MAKVRVHIGGTVVLEVPDELIAGGLDDSGGPLTDALNDAWADLPNDTLFERVGSEWRIVGWAGENEEVDASAVLGAV